MDFIRLMGRKQLFPVHFDRLSILYLQHSGDLSVLVGEELRRIQEGGQLFPDADWRRRRSHQHPRPKQDSAHLRRY